MSRLVQESLPQSLRCPAPASAGFARSGRLVGRCCRLAILASAVNLAAAAHAQGLDPFMSELRPLGQGLYVLVRPEPLRLPVEGNVLFIVNDRDVVVVDSGGAPAAARRAIEHLRQITDLPVRYLINTHGHGDHTGGNQVYVETYPGVEIVAHPETRRYLIDGGLGYVAEIATSTESRRVALGREIETVRAGLAAGAEAVAQHLERYRDLDLDRRSEAYRGLIVTPPTLTVDSSLTLHRGERRIRILFLGHGKTAGDLVLHLPQEKVLVTGDLLTHPIPYGFSRRPTAWLETLRRAAALEFETVVPGHGEILTGRDYLERVIDLVAETLRQTRDAHATGSSGTLAEGIDLGERRTRFTGGDPVLDYRFDTWYREPVVARAAAELAERDR